MSDDDLAERVEELEREVDTIRTNVNAALERLIGERNDRLDEVEQFARSALDYSQDAWAASRSGPHPEDETKVQTARRIARKLVVKKGPTALGGSEVSRTSVTDAALNEGVKLQSKTVGDAFDQLVNEWPGCLSETKREGESYLQLDHDDAPEELYELVRVIDEGLERPALRCNNRG